MSQEFLRPDDPQRIGPYWLASRLGAGGQGVVYEAYDAAGGRCVVKVLRREGMTDGFVRDRFRKEVTASRRVDSFCTARVLAAEPEAQPPYIVSEFVDGRDLQTVVGEGGPIEGDALVRLATGIATALTAIHGASVVHRDLKPGNVLLGPDGPRVIDFGIARTHEMSLTETGKMMGTPGYMAPEVLHGARADGRGDVFAWGAVVLFAATGRAPFYGENLGEIVVRVTEEEPDLAAVPERIRPFVAAALAKDPQHRPSSTELLLSLLTAGGPQPHASSAGELLAEGARAAALPDAAEHAPALLPEWGTLAEETFAALEPMAQAVAQEVLLRLVVPGEAADGSQDGIRTAEHGELFHGRRAHEAAAVEQVVSSLAAARVLVRAADGSVRPVGAALLRAWPRLRAWVAEHRTELRELRRTGESARAWDRAGRAGDHLLHGTLLRAAVDQAATAHAALRPNLVEREFLQASRGHESRRRRRRRQVRGGIAVLVVAALIAGATAWQFQRTNAEQEALATARDVAAVADGMRESDPETAALLSVAAWRVAPADEARAALHRSAQQRETDVFRDPTKEPMGPESGMTRTLSTDGRILVTEASGTSGGEARRFDTRTGKELPMRVKTGTTPLVPSGDGRFAVQGGAVRELGTGKVVGKVRGDGVNVEALASGGGRALEIAEDAGSTVVDTETGRTLRKFAHPRTQLSADGRYVLACPPKRKPVLHDVTAGTATTLREAEVGEECKRDFTVSFSADDRRMAVADVDGSISVWNTASGHLISTMSPASLGLEDPSADNVEPLPVRLSPDGRQLAVMADDVVAVTDVTGVSAPLFTHTSGVKNLDLGMVQGNPLSIDTKRHELRYVDEASVHTLSLEALALSRTKPSNARNYARFDAHAERLLTAQLNEDGSRVGVWSLPNGSDGEGATPRKHKEIRTVSGASLGDSSGEGMVPAVLTPDGRSLAYPKSAGAKSPSVALQNPRTGAVRRSVPLGGPGRGDVAALAMSEDGRTLALSRSAADDNNAWSVDVVDLAAGRKTRTLPHVGGARIALNGTGDDVHLVTSSGERAELATGKVDRDALGNVEITDVAFSPDGQTLAVAERDGIALWKGDASRRMGYLPGPTEGVEGADRRISKLRFSPDSRLLVGLLGQEDRQIHLWDVPSRQPLGGVLPGIDDPLLDAAFDDSGDLHLAGQNVPTHTLHLSPEALTEQICSRVHRANLTHAEWKENVPGVPYREVCG